MSFIPITVNETQQQYSNNQTVYNPFITKETNDQLTASSGASVMEIDLEDKATAGYEQAIKRSKSCSNVLPTQLTRKPSASSIKRFQRRKARLSISPPRNNRVAFGGEDFSEHEFSFNEELSMNSPFSLNSSTSTDSDLESLPDTDESTPNTSPFYNSNKTCFPFFKSNKNISSYFNLEKRKIDEEQERARKEEEETRRKGPSIFEIPEIVYKIVEFADIQNTTIPQESATIRRKPLSFNHAMLIYGNEEEAQSAMEVLKSSEQKSGTPKNGILHNCMLVNKLFYQVTTEFINKKFFFSSQETFVKYLQGKRKEEKQNNLMSPTKKTSPSMIVLHKLFLVKSEAIEVLNKYVDYSNLEWIEFFMCPKLIPSPLMLEANGCKIKKFIVTGSKVLDDNFIIHLSKRCRNLEVLDIRACELVSDCGIYSIGKYCKRLKVINFGRKKRGHLITDNSLSNLVKNNPNLHTIGLAGCQITDKLIWDIAIHCNQSVERLSLNNCSFITNQSIPLILHSNYLPNLSVLELRFVDQLTNFKPMIEFKRRQQFRGISILIEVCEELCAKMRQQEIEMDKVLSKRIFKDILEYVNDNKNDDDVSHVHLINQRRSLVR